MSRWRVHFNYWGDWRLSVRSSLRSFRILTCAVPLDFRR